MTAHWCYITKSCHFHSSFYVVTHNYTFVNLLVKAHLKRCEIKPPSTGSKILQSVESQLKHVAVHDVNRKMP